jgi:hypothetical protein
MAPNLVLLSLITLVAFYIQGTFSEHERPAAISPPSNGTCPARTVNYITHTLPQLCLTSSRAVPTDTTSTEAQSSSSSTFPDHKSASQQGSTTSSQSSLAPKISIAAAVSPSSSTEGADSPPRHTGEPETKKIDQDFDSDSDLGNAKFLSFEEWKRQNLAKSGQSEQIGKDSQHDVIEPRRKPVPASDPLDSLGDDAEIDLDFGGFAAGRPDVAAPSRSAKSSLDSKGDYREEVAAPVTSELRSKDAGTTCKERFNYASFDCAATVLKTNPEAKGASTVLSENKDSYMLNECSADNKFLILELCDDISIDTIVLANFEFFSSIFRTFRVSLSDRYPLKAEKWKTLGTFEARNSREVQAFLVENPLIWARYVRFEFLTHYGSEYYCPVSLIRVHGTTMLEEYKHDLEASSANEDEDEDGISDRVDDLERLVPEAIAEELVKEEGARNQAAPQDHIAETVSASQPSGSFELPETVEHPALASVDVGLCPYNNTNEDMRSMAAIFNTSQPMCSSTDSFGESAVEATTATAHTPIQESVTSTEPSPIYEQNVVSDLPLITRNASSTMAPSAPAPVIDTPLNATHVNTTTTKAEALILDSRNTVVKATNATHIEHTKTTSSTQPPLASPTIQESFFKSVQKRLQMLESNSSLSLQYIEEQSRNLRDAFGRVEQRQLSKTTTFLEYLNSTVLSELRDFRQQYDQLWQSTVIELDMQREQYQKEVLAINSRLAILADEVIFQKRMSILQSILVLLCLGLVLFSRGAMNNYLELPIVQNMLARSPSLRRLNSQMLQTPTESPATTRPSSSHKQNPPYGILKSHQSNPSEDSIVRPSSPADAYSPLTPISFDENSDVDEVKELSRLGSPASENDTTLRPSRSPSRSPSSSPPMLPGTEDTSSENQQSNDIAGPLLTNEADTELPRLQVPRVTVEEATPPAKHLSFHLPESRNVEDEHPQ